MKLGYDVEDDSKGFEMCRSRINNGVSQLDLIVVVALLFISYFGYQYIMVHKAPDKLVNKDFICKTAGGVPAFQDPHSLAAYLRLNSISARFAAPEKAIKNAEDRDRLSATGLVDLNGYSINSPLTERRNPLVVHVLSTYTGEKGLLLLCVQVRNKSHKGETWYISSDNIDVLANVSGFADKAARMHRPGFDDFLESKQGKKVFEKLDKALENQQR